jgi:exopolysaccharide biosynthesis polyprenyl glycosylphosphotransferase
MSTSESVTPRLYAKAISASHEDQLRATHAHLFRNFLAPIEIAADFMTCAAGMFAAYAVNFLPHITSRTQYPLREAVAASITVGLSSALFLKWNGAYRRGDSLLQIHQTERAIRVPALSVLLYLAFGLLLGIRISYTAILAALIVIPVLLILQKLIFSSIFRTLHMKGVGVERAVIYGVGNAGKRVVSALFQSPRHGLLPVAVVDDNSSLDRTTIFEMGYRRRRSVAVQEGPITPEMLKSAQCSVLIVALQSLLPERRNAAVYAAKQAGVRVAFLAGLELQEQVWTYSIDLDGFSLTADVEPLTSWHYAVVKRAIDLFLSAFFMVMIAPLLFIMAFIIKLDSPGPAIFVQKRVGRNGELFNIYKFRSMYVNSPRYDFSPATSHDPRITRVGRLIRQTSLDELPQLMNVFLGNMSLVGPRPEMPFIVQDYTPEHRQRLEVTPGITGLWQLSADRTSHIHENIQYDLYYIRNRNIFMDIAILIHTLFFAVRRDAGTHRLPCLPLNKQKSSIVRWNR